MLVLNLKLDEKVMIGDEIEVHFVKRKGSQVQIGFTAPREIPIHRLKIWNRIRMQRAARKTERQEGAA